MSSAVWRRLSRLAARSLVLVTATASISWLPLDAPRAEAAAVSPNATACTTDGYCYAAFSTVQAGGTWSVPANTYNFDILAVGGGGGGNRGRCSYSFGAGGGGGGFAEVFNQAVTPGATVTISVGGGGNAGPADCNTATPAAGTGGTSSVLVGSVAIYAYGGYGMPSGTGITNSNGGNSGNTLINGVSGSGRAGGVVTWDYTGNCTLNGCQAGGGGGAGAAGSGVNAGTGVVSTLTGVRYAGGGPGASNPGLGTSDAGSCTPAANTGRGGGDCWSGVGGAGAGASGYVYIRYLPGPTATISNQSVALGSTATFTASPTRASNLTSATFTYQWQSSADSGSTWSNISGATAASYTTPTQSNLSASGTQYRVRMTQTGPGSTAATSFNFSSAATLTVTKVAQTINFAALSGKTYGDANFTVSATSTSGLAVGFSSATTSICTVSGSTVSILRAGTCTINADQAGDATFAAAPQVQRSFTVSTRALTITANNDNKVFGGTKTYGSGQTAFTSSGLLGSESIGSVTITASGGTAANDNVGSYTLTPSAAIGGTFLASNYTITYVAGSLSVTAANPSFTWSNQTAQFSAGGSTTLTAPTVNSGGSGTWSYSSSDTTVATTTAGSTVNLLKAGTTVITASFTPSTANYSSGTITMTLTVTKANNPISWTQSLGNLIFGAAPVSLSATAINSGTISYSTNDANVCSVSGSTLSIVGVGTCTVTANQAGDADYLAATAVQKSFTISQASNSISFAAAPTGLVFGEVGQTRTVSATATSGTVSYSTSSSACSVNSSTGLVTILSAGSCTINASASGVSANYQAPQTATQTLTIAPASSAAASWSNASATYAPSGTFAIVPPAVTSSASQSNLAGSWVYASSDTSVATVSGNTLNLLRPGSTTVTGTFTPTSSNFASTTATFTLIVGQGVNAITFAAPSDRTVTSGGFAVSASASSGLAVSITSATTSVCTISNGQVSLVSVGTCTLAANQAGDSNYLAAAQVSRSFVVTPAVVTFNSNFGTPTTSTQSLSSPVGANLNSNTFTRTGYTFLGWSSSANGSVNYSDGQSVAFAADTTLYAVWVAINYGITYIANGATAGTVPVDSSNYNINQTINVRTNSGALTRIGYSFGGWNTAANGSGSSYAAGSTITMGAQAIILYAVWMPNTYTVSYNSNGGTGSAQRLGVNVSSDQYTTAGAAVTLPSVGTLVRLGYNFGGWSTSPTGSALSGGFTTTSNVTLYAVWIIKVVAITYDKGTAASFAFSVFPANSSGQFATQILVGQNIDTNITIGSDSFRFVGWSDGTSTYSAGAPFRLGESDVTFTAIWVRVFAVRSTSNRGTAAAGDLVHDAECLNAGNTCNDAQVITANSAPTRVGYTFNGWVDQNGAALQPAATFTVSATRYLLYATWNPIAYTITYDLAGAPGIAATQNSLNIGQTFTTAQAPSRAGYSFAGWNSGGQVYGAGANVQVGSSNLVFAAVWTPNIYVLSFDWNGGSGTATPDSNYTFASAHVLPAGTNHTKLGHTFAGWSITLGGSAVNLEDAALAASGANILLFARWLPNSYAVVFDSQGGSAVPDGSVTFGSNITLPTAPVKTGFNFVGWFDAAVGGTQVSGSTLWQQAANLTLYARWVAAAPTSLVGLVPELQAGIQLRTTTDGKLQINLTGNAMSTVSAVTSSTGQVRVVSQTPNELVIEVVCIAGTSGSITLGNSLQSLRVENAVRCPSASSVTPTNPGGNEQPTVTMTRNALVFAPGVSSLTSTDQANLRNLVSAFSAVKQIVVNSSAFVSTTRAAAARVARERATAIAKYLSKILPGVKVVIRTSVGTSGSISRATSIAVLGTR